MPPPLVHDDRLSGDHPPAPPQVPPPKANTKILCIFLKGVIMLSITSLFFLLLGLASIILLPLLLSSLRRRRNRRRHRRHESSNGFSLKLVQRLPQFKFSVPTRYGSDCVVCLEGFRQGQWCRRLAGCGHVFHRKCVDAWLVKVAACPICRSRVRLEEEDEQNEEFWACIGQRSSLLDL